MAEPAASGSPASGWGAPAGPADPKRWIALVILSSTLGIIVLDNTILNVAVPTIIRQFHTQDQICENQEYLLGRVSSHPQCYQSAHEE